MEIALSIQQLKKTYGSGTSALRGIDLEIKKGEFFALLGPNGAGKTTLIDILAGPNIKSGGQIKIFGLDIDKHREKTKFMLGIVPQEISFDSFFSVNEVLQIQSGYYGIKNNQDYIDEILEKLGLSDKKHANTRALSGGMKRRLLIAKALVHKPKLVILDEPTAGVDVELRHTLWTYMRELNKDGLTILLTTHYLEEAESLCQRTAIIHKGKLVALDNTKKLVRSMGSSKEITLTFDHEIKETPHVLKAFPVKRLNANELALTFEQGQLSSVLKAIQDLSLVDLDIKGRSLEDVFIQLTYRQDD